MVELVEAGREANKVAKKMDEGLGHEGTGHVDKFMYIAGNDAVDGQGHATLVTETYMSCIKGDKSQGDCWRKNSCILNSNRDLECC